MSTKAEFISPRDALRAGLASLAIAFNRPADKELATVYWLALRDLTAEEIGVAVERALGQCRFFPPPAALRALAGKDHRAAVAEAWEAVRRAVDVHDYTTSVDFGPLVNAVVRNIGGWQRLCALDREALDVWARKEFERIFEAFAPKDPGALNGAPHRGAFGGAPVRIAIGGKLPPRMLREDPRSNAGQLRSLVRELADGKSE